MTNEQLLIMRYRVLVDWPLSPHKAGHIIEVDESGLVKFVTTSEGDFFTQAESYPGLFEPVPWYKFRKLEDMPKFVQLGGVLISEMEADSVYKVIETGTFTPEEIEWLDKDASHFWCKLKGEEFEGRRFNFSRFIPATEKNYLVQDVYTNNAII